MTIEAEPIAPARRVTAQVEGPGVGGSVALPLGQAVPAHLLDGGEIVILQMRPSLWFIPLTSVRWLCAGVFMLIAAYLPWMTPRISWYLYVLGLWAIAARLSWATLQWVSRWYVLTNRRVMRQRGVFRIDVFQCGLSKIQSIQLSLSIPERLTRTGTIVIETAAGAGGNAGFAAWRIVDRPLEVHQKLNDAIHRSCGRGCNGL